MKLKTRKDPNTLAAIEKAIAEKYGKETVQDFRNEWEEEKEKDYLNQLREMGVKRDQLSKERDEVIIGDIKITKKSTTRVGAFSLLRGLRFKAS